MPSNRASTSGAISSSAHAGRAPGDDRATDCAVVVEHLSHRYAERAALDDVSLTARYGEILGFLGPNGSGKTTLFRILSTLMQPTSGRVCLAGLDLATDRDALRQRIAVVFQSPSLDKQLTASENLRHHGHLYGLRGRALAARSEELLERVGLLERRHERVAAFSGGMRRKVEIAKALLTTPRILLLDEPSTGLDPAAREDLMRTLRQVKSTGVAVLVTTHLMEEAERCDQLALLDRGKLIAHAAPADLRAQIGGQILTLHTPDPAALATHLRTSLGLNPIEIDTTLRLELPDPAALIPQILAATPTPITHLSLGTPSLHDVFLHLTGHAFAQPETPAHPAAPRANGS